MYENESTFLESRDFLKNQQKKGCKKTRLSSFASPFLSFIFSVKNSRGSFLNQYEPYENLFFRGYKQYCFHLV